jgi:enoyl-CoA hydratase/carnithine racemase
MRKPFVGYENEGRIATVTFQRPESRNAIAEHDDCADLVAALERANADPEISALILTGAGSAFSAGGNLKNMRDRVGIGPQPVPADTRANYRRGIQKIPEAFMALEIATIAAINGHAIGLGLDLACLCDMRIAADDAKFASSFVKLGIVPGDGGAWILPRVIGYSKAAEMMLTGDTYSAVEAREMGLVGSICPPDQVMAEALKLAWRVAANPPRAVRLTKRLLREGQTARLPEVLQLSAAFQALAHETADHREALAAFFEKRPPVFTGA